MWQNEKGVSLYAKEYVPNTRIISNNVIISEFKMELLVAPVEHIHLDIETALGNQLGAQPLPFAGMDKSGAAVCDFYVKSSCTKAASCPFRHIRGDKTIVCKHWLRGLCKKGDQCEFLHEYDMSKMPECYFYSRFNACHNKECPFLHIDPESKIKDCPWYDRGFCRHGPMCRHRHMRRVLCVNYLAGFCPAGQSCPQAHPRYIFIHISDSINFCTWLWKYWIYFTLFYFISNIMYNP